MTNLHQRTEIYKAGWVRGFYDCRNDEGDCGGPAGISNGPDHEQQLAEYWSGYFDGRAAGRGRVAVKRPLEQTSITELSLTLQVLAQFAAGSSIGSIAEELKTSTAQVEVRLRGAFAAILLFLAERPQFFRSPTATIFEEELVTLAFAFHGKDGRSRAA